jgi:peptidoglycan/xylan/chitin deacetylase (PgdA/CDA1 family)
VLSDTTPAAFTEISMRCQTDRVPVIMYHDVIERRERGSMWYDVTVDELKAQLDKIAELGLTPISLDQLYSHLTQGEPLPGPSIVLTFDDNYQGFYDHAWPLLRERNYPVAMFVHTGFVGNTTRGRPKMTWETLRELVADPLFTVGNHTVTHPDDITKIDPIKAEEEITSAKAELESQLGKKIDYLAYPNGNNDESLQLMSRNAGHKMAFSIHNGLAEESPNIQSINRYIHTRFNNAIEDRDRALRGGALGIARVTLNGQALVRYQEDSFDRIRLGLVTGGMPTTVMSETREGVRDFVQRTGAVAGINGGFFAMSAIASTDNQMVGPLKTPEHSEVLPDLERFRWEKLRNRPLVIWGPKEFAIVPYQADSMQYPETFKDFMPDYTDSFLAGAWLVHNGIARTREEMNVFASSDIQDYRKRAFIGIMADGTFVGGASMGSVSSADVARAAAAAGVQEAVLLDSGFSTSLVYGESIKAYGHSTPTNPSRPVPHAIVIQGQLDPETSELGKK